MFVHYPLFTQNHSPFLYYKKGHILRLLVNCGLSLLPFQVIYCETQILTDQKLTSSTFPRFIPDLPDLTWFNLILRILFQNSSSIFTFRPSVLPPFHYIWPFRLQKPYIFWKLMPRPDQITFSSVLHHFFTSYSSIVH